MFDRRGRLGGGVGGGTGGRVALWTAVIGLVIVAAALVLSAEPPTPAAAATAGATAPGLHAGPPGRPGDAQLEPDVADFGFGGQGAGPAGTRRVTVAPMETVVYTNSILNMGPGRGAATVTQTVGVDGAIVARSFGFYGFDGPAGGGRFACTDLAPGPGGLGAAAIRCQVADVPPDTFVVFAVTARIVGCPSDTFDYTLAFSSDKPSSGPPRVSSLRDRRYCQDRYLLPAADAGLAGAAVALSVANPNPIAVQASVDVGGSVSRFTVPALGRVEQPLPAGAAGPVVLRSVTGPRLVSALVVRGDRAYNELPAAAVDTWSDAVYLPFYDGRSAAGLASLAVGNPSATATVTVQITVGTTVVGTETIPPLGAVVRRYPDVVGGPVEVKSLGQDDADVYATLRVVAGGSFTELPATPVDQLGDTVFLAEWGAAAFDREEIVVAYPAAEVGPTRPITVEAAVGGTVVDRVTVSPRGTATLSNPALRGGPVVVSAEPFRSILASHRTVYRGAFNESPLANRTHFANSFNLRAFFPFIEGAAPVSSTLAVSNPDTFGPASARVDIAGLPRATVTAPPGGNGVFGAAGLAGGPVTVVPNPSGIVTLRRLDAATYAERLADLLPSNPVLPAAGAGPTPVVPEPPAAVLYAGGLAALALLARRRRSRR